jgi:hypothetical protein
MPERSSVSTKFICGCPVGIAFPLEIDCKICYPFNKLKHNIMAISNEKRSLIVEKKLRDETEKSISRWLNISTSSVTVIWRLFEKNGDSGILIG